MSLPPGQKRTLQAVLDVLVPPSADGRMPGAGAAGLGLADRLEEGLRSRPELAPMVEQGLERLDALAAGRAGERFAELDPAHRREPFDALAAEQPGLLGLLLLQTYAAYYSHPRVLEALGQEPRPPHPDGFEVPATDFSLLEPVRRKPPFYRTP